MRKQRILIPVMKLVLGALAMTAGACGGGGGGGSDSGGVTPPAAVTYSVTLTEITLTDRQTDTAVAATGLPLSGAVATRNP